MKRTDRRDNTGRIILKELNYKWSLKEANFTKDRGTVFSCFSCGGGSTMGYKLAGFDVIGCNEIDPRMMEAYKANHNPKYPFLEPIQDFKNRDDLPDELYHLDILDGSPPCSSFSMAGSREDDWGKEKKFREGQADQVLDTLFFDFIDLAKKLQPKIVIAENVKGLLLGEAKSYVNKILIEFDKAGYYVRYDLLDASKMGVPQRRERVFFSAIRMDLYKGSFDDIFETEPSLKIKFNEKEIKSVFITTKGKKISNKTSYIESRFGDVLIDKNKVFPTIVTRNRYFYDLENYVSENTLSLAATFPTDYNYSKNPTLYITGMSVPPLMTAKFIDEVYKQWMEV